MSEYEDLEDKVAALISGAPFPSRRSKDKARSILDLVAKALGAPTAEMVKIGTDARWRSPIRDADNVREIWGSMLAASPLHPPGDSSQPKDDV